MASPRSLNGSCPFGHNNCPLPHELQQLRDVLLRITVKGTIRDILENAIDPLSAVVYIEPNLGVLPSGSGVPQMLGLGGKERSHLESILRGIAKHFDIVLFDTAAGIGPSVLWFNTLVDHNIVVVSPDPTSMTDAYALIKVMFRERDRSDFQILLNSVKNEKEGRDIYDTLANVAGRFLNLSPKHLGSVPQDVELVRAVREQKISLIQEVREICRKRVQQS